MNLQILQVSNLFVTFAEKKISKRLFMHPVVRFTQISTKESFVKMKQYLNLSQIRTSVNVKTTSWPKGVYILTVDNESRKIIIQ